MTLPFFQSRPFRKKAIQIVNTPSGVVAGDVMIAAITLNSQTFPSKIGPELDARAGNHTQSYLETILKVLSQPWELHDLTADLSETSNLADGRFSNHLLYGTIADELAADLRAWLTQGSPGWNAKQPTYLSGGGTVPYPASAVPDVSVPFSRSFSTTAAVRGPATTQMTLTWNSENGFRYDLEASSDLLAWQPLVTGITATGSSTTRTADDPDRATAARRFYRIRLRP